ncbi:AzlD domain-containing protein [Schaalia sp. ZJ405]|uniref:branched-chain amino acid transporter permease n=1 Tax=Schaalia sp. ZJ405 TaxID=2709403 RepID=UPI0013EB3F03|nr:AzlD domain-containing protein [Schaalia sp. ZJ405]QPK81442.1 AzlD domain-containing protein [Schaalia sp. ZJ405]
MNISVLYLLGILVVVFLIDFGLRAIPFAILEPLRDSRFVGNMAAWMPAGIMVILVAATLRDGIEQASPTWWIAILAAAVTAVVHLIFGRRLILSVAAGTVTYVVLLSTFA